MDATQLKRLYFEVTRCQFHQYFTSSFYEHRSGPKSAKWQSNLWLFVILGSACAKAAYKILMKSTLGCNEKIFWKRLKKLMQFDLIYRKSSLWRGPLWSTTRCQFHQRLLYIWIFCMNVVSAAFSSYVLALPKNLYKKALVKCWWNWR